MILSNGNGEWAAEYDVTVPAAGLYQIESRYAAAGSRPTQLFLNGQVIKTDALKEVTGSWNPDTQRWHIEGSYEFKAGVNVIRLYRQPPLPHIDKLLIARLVSGTALAVGRRTDNLDDSPAASAEPLNPLRPAFVSQWRRLLEKTIDDANTPFTEWRGS